MIAIAARTAPQADKQTQEGNKDNTARIVQGKSYAKSKQLINKGLYVHPLEPSRPAEHKAALLYGKPYATAEVRKNDRITLKQSLKKDELQVLTLQNRVPRKRIRKARKKRQKNAKKFSFTNLLFYLVTQLFYFITPS